MLLARLSPWRESRASGSPMDPAFEPCPALLPACAACALPDRRTSHPCLSWIPLNRLLLEQGLIKIHYSKKRGLVDVLWGALSIEKITTTDRCLDISTRSLAKAQQWFCPDKSFLATAWLPRRWHPMRSLQIS